MEQISIKGFHSKYGNGATASVLKTMGYEVNRTSKKKIIAANEIVLDVPNEEETIGLMGTINKVITNPRYTSTQRNRFYAHKHKIIRLLIESGKITEAVKSESCYKFSVYGQEFHQPTYYFDSEHVKFKIVGDEEYGGKAASEGVFTDEQWRSFVIGAAACRSRLYKELKNKKKGGNV